MQQATSLADLPIAEREQIIGGAWAEVEALATARSVWTPQPGPQTAAYESTASIIGYGGSAGGGKTDLLLGKAGTQHRRSIIFRRVYPSLRGMIERSREIFNPLNQPHSDDSYNEQLHVWRLTGSRLLEFASVQHETDLRKFQGQPHDFIGVDEATELPESFVRFLWGWNRTTIKGQLCQTVLTFNPPLDEAGEWVVRVFAPWVDKDHTNPAADGELRWYAMVNGHEIECGPELFENDGAIIVPKSRTFFHAALKDNPALQSTGYGATIDAMPEPLRSLLKGNFDAAKISDPWQVIPAAWVRAAQARWTETPPDAALTALGCDPARGGRDDMAVAPLHGRWFAPVATYPGAAVPDGPTAAALLTAHIKSGVAIGIDVIGIGSSVYDCVRGAGGNALPINNSESVPELRDKSERLKFRNLRAASYWRLREALDPDNGQGLALPPDSELLADLCAPRYGVSSMGIQLEDKDDIKVRLGRSPNKGDAIVMAWWVAQFAGPLFYEPTEPLIGGDYDDD